MKWAKTHPNMGLPEDRPTAIYVAQIIYNVEVKHHVKVVLVYAGLVWTVDVIYILD